MEDLLLFNLQMFNDEGATDGEDTSADTPPEDKDESTEGKDTFTQEDVDGIIAKRIARERAKFEKDFKVKLDQEKKEAERLAKLSEDDRAKELSDKERADFEAERLNFQREKLELQITKELAEKGLPVRFASLLVAEDAEISLANIKSFEKDWQAALEKAVTDKLKGKSPGAGSTTATESGLGKRLAEQRKQSEPTEKVNPYF